MDYKILQGNALARLKELPDEFVNCVVTSPPYWGLRDYGTAKWEGGQTSCNHGYEVSSCYNKDFNERWGNSPGNKKQESERHFVTYKDTCKNCGAIRIDDQIGLEPSPELFVNNLVNVFKEVKRILKNDGTLWVNIGDSYSSMRDSKATPDSLRGSSTGTKVATASNRNPSILKEAGLKHKDLVGIPWMLAFALRADNWYLRQDIIWSKLNPMPESVTDRCTKSHEYLFLLSKSPKYYFDNEIIKEPTVTKDNTNRDRDSTRLNNTPGRTRMGGGLKTNNYDMRNKRSVWTINTQPFKGAHFAVFPEKLVTPCILAGCPENGTVLDPFNGSGTTGVVALRNMRNYIGIELNPEYIELSYKRIQDSVGMFAERIV